MAKYMEPPTSPDKKLSRPFEAATSCRRISGKTMSENHGNRGRRNIRAGCCLEKTPGKQLVAKRFTMFATTRCNPIPATVLFWQQAVSSAPRLSADSPAAIVANRGLNREEGIADAARFRPLVISRQHARPVIAATMEA
jgi:hypothetical protein